VAARNQINRRRREKAMAIKKAKCGKNGPKRFSRSHVYMKKALW
jgi:hypothetical protein